jgi:hypothetical protein
MNRKRSTIRSAKAETYRLQADLAFFEARLALAGVAADTCYHRAQIKAFTELGEQLGRRLPKPRPKPESQPPASDDTAAA